MNFKFNSYEVVVMFLSAIASFIMTFTETWIWSPFWSLILLFVVLLADFLCGLSVSLKRGGTFESKKAWSWYKRTVFTVFLLGISFNAGRLNTAFGVDDDRLVVLLTTFPTGLYLWTFITNLISVVKNAVILNWMDGKVAEWIYRHFDKSKNDPTDKHHDLTGSQDGGDR